MVEDSSSDETVSDEEVPSPSPDALIEFENKWDEAKIKRVWTKSNAVTHM